MRGRNRVTVMPTNVKVTSMMMMLIGTDV